MLSALSTKRFVINQIAFKIILMSTKQKKYCKMLRSDIVSSGIFLYISIIKNNLFFIVTKTTP